MSTSPVLAIGPGSMLGRYQVLAHLATGGMAEIFLARATGLEGFERHVVVKCIKPEHARDQRFVGMFIDEARLSAQLHHQNIAQVYDIGQEGGAYYFAMEYVHGENVRELLHATAQRRQYVPLEHALTIIAGAAAGLHYAHDKRGSDRKPLGIVHRDVSPSNIIVAYDGAVKVVDFGIAKAAARMTETRSGTLKGKISYMSPEQCTGKDIDRRSDVFALGIVLYELTTVTRLFKGESDYVTMNKIVMGEVEPPSSRRPDYPRGLEPIVMKALATEPDQRHPTVAAFLDDIIGFCQREKIATSSIGLERYLRDLFGEKPEPWLASRDDLAVEELRLPPPPALAGAGTPGGGIPLPAGTSTHTRAAEPSGLTATPAQVAPVASTGPGSQGSLLLSAEIESRPDARPRRAMLWLGSATLAGAALIGGAVMFKREPRGAADDARPPVIAPPAERAPAVPPDAGVPDDAAEGSATPAIDAAAPAPAIDAGTGAAGSSSGRRRSSRGGAREVAPPPAPPPADAATPPTTTTSPSKARDARDLRPPD